MQPGSKLKIIDLSQPLFHHCPRCPSDPPVESKLICKHRPDGWQVEWLTLSSHAGTHVDAPLHKIKGGSPIDALPLERFTGWAMILDCRDARPGQPFTSSMLSRLMRRESRLKEMIVLIATGWGRKRAQTETWERHSPFLSPDGAEWLVEQEIRGVGIDHYSIGGSVEPSNTLTHQVLLGANIWIVEDLQFPDVAFQVPQPVQYWGLPIHLRGHSGAFCRPVLVLEE